MVSHLKGIHLLYQKELGRIMCQLIHFCKKKENSYTSSCLASVESFLDTKARA